MPLRSYDPTIARWNRIDPVTHHSLSTYNAFDNNPIYYADPSGGNSFRGGHANRLQRMRDNYFGSEYSNLDSFVARANSHPPARDNNSGDNGGGGSSTRNNSRLSKSTLMTMFDNSASQGSTMWNNNGNGFFQSNTGYVGIHSSDFMSNEEYESFNIEELAEVIVTKGDINSYVNAALDIYGEIEHNYTGLNDILLGAGLTGIRKGYNANYNSVNRAYHSIYKTARNKGINMLKPGVQRQALKRFFSNSKVSASSKLLRRAGIAGSLLTAGNIAIDAYDGSINTSSAVDAVLLGAGVAAAIIGGPVTAVVGAGILIYGILDYSFDISEKLDEKFGEHKIFD